ncbi:rab3 GTPase-activating protein non-catalytic subunit [Schistocerca piceifrons]|uniref:rab3 GTPase-activating protein non-catalytic subunit n=1 Tax=Schistocerca piceifrons TaxID=274613 RepID=UPI001F5F9C31|nr:rab3 GTPase-activating protein non-catalytic subunit [Schistocerca piceifrons]
MSCQIKTFSYFADIDNVKRFLFPNFLEDEWDWPEDDVNDNAVVNNDKESAWLQECHVSLSPFGDVLAIARKSTLVILMSKWDTQEQGEVKMKFHVVWHGNPCKEEDEEITAVLCLPVIAPGKSSHVAPDWTCIAVGFSTGFLRLYSETVNLLAEELLHDEPVTSLKCQSFHPARGGMVQEQVEEVYVAYNTVICSLPGFGLFQSLRACRNQLARVKANCAEVLKAPPLMYKKWGFQEQEVTADSEMVGISTANTFDHLVTASLCGGFGAYYRSSAPQTLLVVGAGKKPFVGFHYALEGGPQPVLTDMAKAVATKLKTAIGQAVPFSGWWSGAKKANGAERPKDKVALEAVEPMVCRFGLCDQMRNGDKVIISPNRRLSVVTDSLGRIVLIDNHKGIALRMWKGYREAQCSWIEVQEEIRQRSTGIQPRLALFLVIFSPKRGSIEIWAMEQGPKVATFKVSAHGRLLYLGHGFMGLNNTSMKGGNRSQFPCVFIDSSGSLNEIIVPFHFALSDKNSRRARDLHLLKKLKTFLKEVDFEDDRLLEEVQKTMSELKTNEIRLQAIEMLSSNKYSIPEALEIALNECVDKLSVQDPETLDHTGKLLLRTTQNLQKLVSFYQFVRQQQDKPPSYNAVVATDLKTPQDLSGLLRAPEREMNSLLSLLATIDTVEGKSPRNFEARVGFPDDKSAFVDFLSSFEINNVTNNAASANNVSLKKDTPEDKIKRISNLVYQGSLYSDVTVDTWRAAAATSGIEPLNLMQLALQFWLQKREGAALQAEMLRFMDLLQAICSLTDVNHICTEYNEVSPWWQEVRAVLTDSTNPFMALTGAIICRAVAISLEKIKELGNKNSAKDAAVASNSVSEEMSLTPDDEMRSSASEWENVSRDICQWSLLIGQLEDVALLDAVLRQKPLVNEGLAAAMRNPGKGLLVLPFTKPIISLNYVLEKGKGSISELVARWLSSAGLEAASLVDLRDAEFDALELQQGAAAQAPLSDEDMPSRKERLISHQITEGDKVEADPGMEAAAADERQLRVLEFLAILKHHFPYSLSSSILLANLCWEYILHWQHNPDNMVALHSAIHCLNIIPSVHMKHGICSLIWSMHLKQRFESAAKLIHKAGKIPKETNCYQDVGISDIHMTEFLGTSADFLNLFMDAVTGSTGTSCVLRMLRSEELWHSDAGPPPLAQLALSQSLANFDLVHLHRQLATALQMMMAFSMRLPRPIATLFDTMSQAAMFTDMSSNPQLPGHSPNPKLLNSRTQFLLRVISAAMQMIRPVDGLEDATSSKGVQLDTTAAVQWMSKCYYLASVWGVYSDDLRRHQVCELYASGYDRLAEEILPAVNDVEKLASQLLLIVGQRLRKLLTSSENFCDRLSRISPSLSIWLDSLNGLSLRSVAMCSVRDTSQLLAQAVQHMSDDHPEYQLALHMVDAIHDLSDDVDLTS